MGQARQGAGHRAAWEIYCRANKNMNNHTTMQQSRMSPYDTPYDIGATIDRHYEFRKKVIPELLALSKKAFTLQTELDAARAQLEQSRKWIQYYKNEAERVKREYGFYLVTKSAS
jgi:hypothetical protein